MNRIADQKQSPPTLTAKTKLSPPRFASKPPQLRYSLLGPQHYESNYAYPLVVWIHGPEDDERQVYRIMPHVSLRNYVAVAPRGTFETAKAANGGRTFTWQQNPDEITTALDRVLDCVDLASARFNVDRRRIFLAGYDEGGTMAIRLAASKPKTFAGVASFGGAFPRGHMPLRHFRQVRDMPLMLAFGRDAQCYHRGMLCEDLKLIHACGMKSLSIRQYPCGDDLVTQMLKDFNAWVMELVTGYRMDSSSKQFDELN